MTYERAGHANTTDAHRHRLVPHVFTLCPLLRPLHPRPLFVRPRASRSLIFLSRILAIPFAHFLDATRNSTRPAT